MYYFRQSDVIDLSINTGVAAQYGSKSEVERPGLNGSNIYLAHKIVAQAMRLFNSKSIVSCIEELNILYNYNKDDANAQFYLGLCYFQLGKFSLAQSFFNKNADNSINIFYQESAFYEALCFINLNQAELAKAQLQRIVANKGFYADRARETLLKL